MRSFKKEFRSISDDVKELSVLVRGQGAMLDKMDSTLDGVRSDIMLLVARSDTKHMGVSFIRTRLSRDFW
jgi:hypothetical protein